MDSINIVCQMLSPWTENVCFVIHLLHIFTKLKPLGSPSMLAPNELKLTLIAQFSPKLAYMHMLFIRQLTCPVKDVGQIENK